MTNIDCYILLIYGLTTRETGVNLFTLNSLTNKQDVYCQRLYTFLKKILMKKRVF